MNWKWECKNKTCGRQIVSSAYIKEIYVFCSKDCMDEFYTPKNKQSETAGIKKDDTKPNKNTIVKMYKTKNKKIVK